MRTVSQRRQRSSVVALAALALAGGVLVSFNACSLDSNGLGTLGADGGGDGAPPPVDATLDATEAGPPPDAVADVVRGDGCATIETNCLDEIDNDCNGLTDCADPGCTAGYACAPAPSPATGFTGFAVYEPTRSLPCPAAYPTQADTYENLIFLPASCAPCSCAAAGATCGAATLTCSSGGGCNPDGGTSAVIGESCAPIDGGITLGPASSCSLGAPAVTPGACTPGGGAATVNPVTFGQLSRVCAATEGPGGGCGAGSVCVARPATGFHGACVSVVTDSTVSCPAGYLNAHVTMPDGGSFSDTRGCSSCSCAGPTGAACSGSATLYASAGCAGTPAATLPADTACHPVPSTVPLPLGSAVLNPGAVNQGSCAPDGGQPIGAVKPRSQTVYCCQD